MLVGMCLTQADGWPAHLARMHQALTALPGHDQVRLGVIADWKYGPHLLTCWQTERTFGPVTAALGKDAARSSRPRPTGSGFGSTGVLRVGSSSGSGPTRRRATGHHRGHPEKPEPLPKFLNDRDAARLMAAARASTDPATGWSSNCWPAPGMRAGELADLDAAQGPQTR